jgi:peptidyl-dipeptidase Dcp
MSIDQENPLLQRWDTPYELPPFDRLRVEHFVPAMNAAMAAQRAELDAIATRPDAPTFANTITALDASGELLARVSGVFWNLVSSETSPALQEAERELAPRVAAHQNAMYLDARLFARIAAVHEARAGLGLSAEQLRLVERIQMDFVMAGARLSARDRERAAAINEELASLCTTFAQNVLADESTGGLELEGPGALAGLPAFVVEAAQAAAAERGQPGKAIITLSRSLVVPFLTYSDRRDLREQAFRAWTRRGELSPDRANLPIAQKILALRQELAALHGAPSYTDYALRDTMAGHRDAVLGLLNRVWEPARRRAAEEARALQDLADERGDKITIEPWDWRYYAEKVRAQRYDLDEASAKPYFELGRMVRAVFAVAERLFGLKIVRREGLALYHPDVEAYEVQDAATGALIGLFLSDNYARPTKRSGAWMSSYRDQSSAHGGPVQPIVVNNNNFARAPAGQPTLLSIDDVRTLFHEFGHGLHGLLSNVGYRRLSGTSVLRDFVELPSQLMEHWVMQPAVLREFALHAATNEPIPDELIAKLRRAGTFNQGFDSVEFTASALVDLALHARPDAGTLDLASFEQQELARLGMPPQIVMRHRLPHFLHIFSGSDYASAYYVYLWAAVLDHDAFGAFEEAGDIFHPPTAARLRSTIYGAGNTVEPGAAYRAFRGRDPDVTPMLRNRGLLGDTTAPA